MAFTYSRFLGMTVYPVPFLRPFFPFLLSGSFAFFAFSAAHTALMNGTYHNHSVSTGRSSTTSTTSNNERGHQVGGL